MQKVKDVDILREAAEVMDRNRQRLAGCDDYCTVEVIRRWRELHSIIH